LDNFEIHHNFSNDKGKISLKINKEHYVGGSDIKIQFPVVVDNKTIEVYYWEENGEKIYLNTWYTQLQQYPNWNYSMIIINDIPFPKNNDKYFYSISYEMEILPHGHFKFYHNNVDFFGSRRSIVFDLGEKYKCDASCIYQLTSITADYANTNKKLILSFEKTKSHSFILKGIRDIRKKLAWLVGFLVSSLMAALLLFKDILENLFYRKE